VGFEAAHENGSGHGIEIAPSDKGRVKGDAVGASSGYLDRAGYGIITKGVGCGGLSEDGGDRDNWKPETGMLPAPATIEGGRSRFR